MDYIARLPNITTLAQEHKWGKHWVGLFTFFAFLTPFVDFDTFDILVPSIRDGAPTLPIGSGGGDTWASIISCEAQ